MVSIHAPARGATATVLNLIVTILFQSTHPRGVRLVEIMGGKYTLKCFNPRTREGCDSETNQQIRHKIYVSIHAPARGATWRDEFSPDFITFQSTHPRGVRQHIQKCIEYQYAKLCFLRHNAKLLKTRHIRHRRKRQPTDFQRLR